MLSFDSLDLRQVEVEIQGKLYLLREATGAGAARWRGAVIRAARFGADGKVERLDGAADSELILVNECLVDASGRRTPLQVLQGWPARVVKALFEEAKRISELDEAPGKKEEPTDPTLPAGSGSLLTSACPSGESSAAPPNGS
jgi:hypothetical protein